MKFIDIPSRQSACSVLGVGFAVTHGKLKGACVALVGSNNTLRLFFDNNGVPDWKPYKFTLDDIHATDWYFLPRS